MLCQVFLLAPIGGIQVTDGAGSAKNKTKKEMTVLTFLVLILEMTVLTFLVLILCKYTGRR
jgi:hypothetical protein